MKEFVDELNARRDGNTSIAKKSLIVCGLIPGEDGQWKKEQLTIELQTIVNDNMQYFAGQHPQI